MIRLSATGRATNGATPRAHSWARRAFAGTLQLSGLLPVAKRLDRSRPDVLRVLLFHRIAEFSPPGGDPGLISATPAMFARQMDYIARQYEPVTAGRVVEAIQGHAGLPPRAVLVTFDDGYTDLLECAWPILRARGIPAVVFVPTAFPGSARRFWWDVVHDTIAHTSEPVASVPALGAFPLRTSQHRRLTIQRVAAHLLRCKPGEIEQITGQLEAQLGRPAVSPPSVMTWEQLRRLAREGLTVASHTRTHPAVPVLTPEEIEDELRGAQADLTRELGAASPLFAFPFGLSDPRALPVLRDRGIVASFTAFTPHPPLNIVRRVDPLLLRREAVGGTTSFVEFCLGLTSLYARLQAPSLVQAMRRRVRQWTGP